jgi:hypothetical protein
MRQSGRISGSRMNFSLASKRYSEDCFGLGFGSQGWLCYSQYYLFLLSQQLKVERSLARHQLDRWLPEAQALTSKYTVTIAQNE